LALVVENEIANLTEREHPNFAKIKAEIQSSDAFENPPL
jgi:hypothetical protein